ncbi:MAG: S-layer homology domain-containing protein [Clostridia bacterium]|nr:S-layer homology domain-containing protein [Clostridia bacterium]
MFKAKKLTSFILSACMALGFGATSFAAVPNDAQDSKYKDAIEVLGALEIMIGDAETGAFRPNDTIKRSEFAKVAVTSMGLGNIAQSSEHATKYPDVVENHWANGYINVATNQGIVIGDDEGNFRPDDTITYAEAVTVLVRLVGHTPAAEKKGGFPTGYVSIASQLGITNNAVAGNDSSVLRGMVAQMTNNALTVKKMEQTSFGGDESYEVVDKTLLGDELDTEIIKGQITAIGTSSLSGTSTLKNNEIRIGETVYEVEDKALAQATRLLGFNIEAFIREDENGDKKLILARAEKGKNSSVKIVTGDIEKITEGDMLRIDYWEDKENDTKTKYANVKNDAKFVFNGKAISYNVSELKPESGSLTLLDQNRDDVYDVVFIESYENYVVEEVIESSNRITDKYGKSSLVLDPENEDVKFIITRGGQEISIKDLKEWDVLSVATSKDKTIIMVEVTTESIKGLVEEKRGDKFVIGGEEFGVSANYPGEIKLGDEGTFYLDKDRNIAAVDATSGLSSNYSYLVGAELTTGFDKVLQIKIFDKNGDVKILKSGSKIKLDETSNKTPEEVLDALNGDDENVDPQLITIETNSEGVLTRIDLAKNSVESGEIDKNNFSLNAKGTLSYRESAKKLGSYNVDKNTIIFDIPEGETDPEKYSIENIEILEDGTDYDVLVYDVGEDLTAKVVIVTNSNGIANLEASAAIVEKISTVINDDNETVERLYAFIDGERKSFLTAEDDVLVNGEGAALKAGDIIQLKTNSANEIESIRILFEADNKEVEGTETIDEDLVTVYGKVIKKFANSINVSVNGGAVSNYAFGDAKVYEFSSDKSTSPIKVVEPGDIPQYDELDESRVFIRIYKDEVKEIVIVR